MSILIQLYSSKSIYMHIKCQCVYLLHLNKINLGKTRSIIYTCYLYRAISIPCLCPSISICIYLYSYLALSAHVHLYCLYFQLSIYIYIFTSISYLYQRLIYIHLFLSDYIYALYIYPGLSVLCDAYYLFNLYLSTT